MSQIDLSDQDRIDRQASAWLVKVKEGDLNRGESAGFQAWLTRDPRNRATYEALQRTWSEISALEGLAHLVPLNDPAGSAERKSRRRPALWAGAGIAAALVLAMAPMVWLMGGEGYATGVSEMRLVTLADGSSVTLGPRSAIRVTYTDRDRRVALLRGEAFFDVIHNGRRPFIVTAGPSVVRDVGTKFDVNLDSALVRVAVQEGAVQVSGRFREGQTAPRLISAGQRTELRRTIEPALAEQKDIAVQAPAQEPGAWREGRLIFDDVRLSDVVADLNRYYRPGVRLASGVEDLRVTASFKASEIPAFLSALGDTLPVRTDQNQGGEYVVRPRPSS